MKQLSTILTFWLCMILPLGHLSAEGLQNSKLSDKTIKLAMLDLTKHGFVLPANKANKKVKFANNCTDWEGWQIN